MMKMTMSISIWGAQHPNAGGNIQHILHCTKRNNMRRTIIMETTADHRKVSRLLLELSMHRQSHAIDSLNFVITNLIL